MGHFNIADAKARLSELIDKAMSGEEVIVARDNRPLLKLVPLSSADRPRVPGSARGQVWISSDFNETPEDFAEYI